MADERDAGDLLRKMGMKVEQMRIGGDNKKGVAITRKQLDDLTQRFSLPADPVPETEAVEERKAA